MDTATRPAPPPSITHRVVNDEPISPGEYLKRERERETNERFEFIDGWVIALHDVVLDREAVMMTGPTIEHNSIVSNINGELRERLRTGNCRAMAPAPRVSLPEDESYFYPDALVVCGPPKTQNGHRDTITNPQVIVEVLSPSTMDYDRGEKFARYRQLDSLREYLLVAQDRPHVEHYVRQGDGSWRFVETDGRDAEIDLPTLDASLPLSEVYLDVSVESDETE